MHKSVNIQCGFVHTRLHTHRTGNCICKLGLVCVINYFLVTRFLCVRVVGREGARGT